mgnify:CR=1 FL=1
MPLALLLHGLNDQAVAFLAHGCFLGIQLKLARDTQCLVPAIAEQADMTCSFSHDFVPFSETFGICQDIGRVTSGRKRLARAHPLSSLTL